MNTFVQILACGFVAILCGACSPSMSDYKATIRDGIRTIPHVQEIKRVFSRSQMDHFITQFGFDKGKPVMWQTEVFFGGRYILTYHIYVIVDYTNNKIVKTNGAAGFTLVKVSRVFDDTPENIGADFGEDYKLSEAGWEKVVAAGGDFSVIGISIDTNHPVARFDDYVNAIRRDRVQVE